MYNFLKSFFCRTDMQLTSAGQTDTGLLRENNEDNFGIIKQSNIFIVADGMGGHNAGEVASRVAVDSIQTYFNPEVLNSIRGNSLEIRHSMITSFQSTNEIVMKMAVENERLQGMGCTLVMGFVDDDILHTCHVGDARCYVTSENDILQITTDHTSLAEIQEEYGDNPDNFEQLPTRNVVTRVIGYPFPDAPEYNSVKLYKDSRILFCSDGLWSMVDDQMIRNTLISSESPEEAVSELIKFANDAGGNDNITGVVVFA